MIPAWTYVKSDPINLWFKGITAKEIQLDLGWWSVMHEDQGTEQDSMIASLAIPSVPNAPFRTHLRLFAAPHSYSVFGAAHSEHWDGRRHHVTSWDMARSQVARAMKNAGFSVRYEKSEHPSMYRGFPMDGEIAVIRRSE